jgi:hypothetical protein
VITLPEAIKGQRRTPFSARLNHYKHKSRCPVKKVSFLREDDHISYRIDNRSKSETIAIGLTYGVSGFLPSPCRLRAPILNPLTYNNESASKGAFSRAGGTRTHTHSRVEDFKFLGFVSIPYNCVYCVYNFYKWGVKVSIVSILSIRTMLIAH